MKYFDSKRRSLKSRIIKCFAIALLASGCAYAAWLLLTSASLRRVSFTFTVDDPARFVALELAAPKELHDWTLNGWPVPVPFAGMQYEKIPAIPARLLVKGKNILRVAVPLLPQFTPQPQVDFPGEPFNLKPHYSWFKVRLAGLTATAPCLFTISPVLGFAGEDFFTVTCQTNMPVPVRLEVAGRALESPESAVHSWRVDGLQPGRDYDYRLIAVHPLTEKATISGPYHVRTFGAGDELTFAACGDSRSNPDIWARIAALIRSKTPAFFIHTGDMVKEGLIFDDWQREMFEPAAEVLASVPLYPVIGNHEYNASIFQRMFQTSTGTTNWEQRIGPAHVIGINGELDWRTSGEPYAWLRNVLNRSTAPFIFLVTHYPPYSSARHGKLSGDEPGEETARQIHDTILPLLVSHHITAIIAGHSHSYERSELNGGVSLITTAGAGAGLMNEHENAQKQNPYSKIYVKAFNIAVFQIHGATCEIKAFDIDGKVLDTRIWQARSMQPAENEPKK